MSSIPDDGLRIHMAFQAACTTILRNVGVVRGYELTSSVETVLPCSTSWVCVKARGASASDGLERLEAAREFCVSSHVGSGYPGIRFLRRA